jgi:lipopolysaccharide transport system permease protein
MTYYAIPLTIHVLYALPILAVLLMLTTAFTLVLSAINVRFRDVGVAIPFLLQFLMYATPVIYPLSAVPRSLLPFYLLNPLVGVIEGFRRVVLHGSAPDVRSLAISTFVSVGFLLGAYLFFKRTEATMADII